MTDDLLQSVDSKAKQEDLLKEGEDIMMYFAVESLAKGIEKGKAEGTAEKWAKQIIDSFQEKK